MAEGLSASLATMRPLQGLAVRIAIQLTPVDEEESDTVVGVVVRTCN